MKIENMIEKRNFEKAVFTFQVKMNESVYFASALQEQSQLFVFAVVTKKGVPINFNDDVEEEMEKAMFDYLKRQTKYRVKMIAEGWTF